MTNKKRETKSILLWKENTKEYNLQIYTLIDRNGNIRKRGGISIAEYKGLKNISDAERKSHRLRKHSKVFSIASGKEDNIWRWCIKCKVDGNGEIKRNDKIIIENNENMRQYTKKYRLTHHKEQLKCKTLNLLNGIEDDWSWRIRLRVDKNGKFVSRGTSFSMESLEKERKNAKRYRRNNLLKCREADKRRSSTHQRKETMKKCYNKRRNLGFNPLNKILENIPCDAHHINENDIIYIPQVIHRRIQHNQYTGKNMKLINSIAYSFL